MSDTTTPPGARAIRTYVADIPFRGYKTVVVEAGSAAEAKRLIDDNDDAVEGIDTRIEWSGKAQDVRLDGGRR